MNNPNIAVMERLVSAVMEKDADAIREILTPDFELHQPKELVYGGVYKGPEAFIDFLDIYIQAFDLQALDRTGLYTDPAIPDALILGFAIRGMAYASGKAFDSTLLERWNFRDGKIAGIVVHWHGLPD